MILVYAGRRADPQDGSTADLSAENLSFIRERIERLIASLHPDLVIGSGANGTDLLVLEAALRRRGVDEPPTIHVVVGPTVEGFRESSVADRPGAWGATFDGIIGNAASRRLELVDAGAGDPYRAINTRILELARTRKRDTDEIIGLIVRGNENKDPDYTRELEAQLLASGCLVITLDPGLRRAGRRVCFVAMPYGRKRDLELAGLERDMDAVYDRIFVPLLEERGFDYRRADRQFDQGLIRASFVEQLLDADVVIADLTTHNANVAWELGLRHVAKKATTILVATEGTRQIFDVADVPLYGYPYGGSVLSEREAVASVVALRPVLDAIDLGRVDSPFRSVMDVDEPIRWRSRRGAGDIVADQMLDQAARAFESRDEAALRAAADAVGTADLSRPQRRVLSLEVARLSLALKEYGCAVQLLEPLVEDDTDVAHPMLREQLALALYRPEEASMGDIARAERILGQVLERWPQSVEALGMLAAVAKRRMRRLIGGSPAALQAAVAVTARNYEDAFRATSAYWHGVNALSLRRVAAQHMDGPLDLAERLLPVVRFFAESARDANPDEHWPWASLGEVELSAALLLPSDAPSLSSTRTAYAQAVFVAGRDEGAIASMREQLSLLNDLGDPVEVVDELLALLVPPD